MTVLLWLIPLIPLAGFLMLIQGIAEILRCWKAMREGVWLERLEDVRETEDILIATDAAKDKS